MKRFTTPEALREFLQENQKRGKWSSKQLDRLWELHRHDCAYFLGKGRKTVCVITRVWIRYETREGTLHVSSGARPYELQSLSAAERCLMKACDPAMWTSMPRITPVSVHQSRIRRLKKFPGLRVQYCSGIFDAKDVAALSQAA